MKSQLQLRAGRAEDATLIRRMIVSAHLDPTSLHWPNFWVAEIDQRIVGLAQVKPYRDCREFGSLLVLPEFRGQGIAAQLIGAALAHECGPVHLLCIAHLERFYARFGFQRVPFAQAPSTLRLKLTFGLLLRLFGQRLICMRRLPGP